jgi:hypothetical protein
MAGGPAWRTDLVSLQLFCLAVLSPGLASLRALHLDGDLPRQEPAPIRRTGEVARLFEASCCWRVFDTTRRVTASISGCQQLRPYDSGMAAQPALPSLSILLEQVASERATIESHAESLDTKAGVVLGFTGVLVGLGATAQAMIAANGVFQAGLGVAVAAALLATWAFVPRRYPVLEVQVLRGNLTAPEDETQLELLDTQIEMVREAAVLVRRKGLRVGLSIGCLAAAAGLVVIGTLVAGGQVHA